MLSGAEFPDFDGPLLEPLRTASRSAAAARALSQDPAAIPTFILLVENRQPDAAIGVLEAIVARHPDRIAAAMTALAERSHSIEDEASGRSERLRALVRTVKTKLPSLPREQAASIDYAPIGPDVRLDRTGSRENPARMRRIIQLYPGTAAARLAEVDAIERHMPTSAGVEALEAFARAHPGTVEGAKALSDARIGGTRVRQASHVMETPNQPIGMSREILAFWTRSFRRGRAIGEGGSSRRTRSSRKFCSTTTNARRPAPK